MEITTERQAESSVDGRLLSKDFQENFLALSGLFQSFRKRTDDLLGKIPLEQKDMRFSTLETIMFLDTAANPKKFEQIFDRAQNFWNVNRFEWYGGMPSYVAAQVNALRDKLQNDYGDIFQRLIEFHGKGDDVSSNNFLGAAKAAMERYFLPELEKIESRGFNTTAIPKDKEITD